MEPKTSLIQASIRGNKETGIPNQDYIGVFEDEDYLIATVSDGLGSSKNSLDGARISCKCVIEGIQEFPITNNLAYLGNRIKDKWEKEIETLSVNVSDYNTTNSFVAVFKKDMKIIVGRLGDVLVSLRVDGLFRYLEPNSKDFLNETSCLGSGSENKYNLVLFSFGYSYDFIIATDGIADEVQTDKIEALHYYLKSKFNNIEELSRNNALKTEIETFINDKNNDDKSMIFIWTN